MKEYIVEVRYASRGLRVFRVKTNSIYRIIGKIYCTALDHIEKIDYSRYTAKREQFLIDEGYEINRYKEPMLSEETEW